MFRAVTLLVLGSLSVLATALLAQNPGHQFSGLRHLPFDFANTKSMAAGDLDGDGDIDLVVGNTGNLNGEVNKLYLNEGRGDFVDATAGRLPTMKDNTYTVLLVDVDRDGDLDILLGNTGAVGAPNRLMLNDGHASFADVTATHLPAGAGECTTSLAAADVDGDGDVDFVAGNMAYVFLTNPQNRLYLNDGTGHFTDATAGRMPALADQTRAVVFADVDGDGDADLVVGNYSSTTGGDNELLLNDGKGNFSDASSRLPTGSYYTSSVATGDIDGDGDIDLVFGTAQGQPNRLFLNDGSGSFTDASAARLPPSLLEAADLALVDIDKDRDMDLVIANFSDPTRMPLSGAQNQLFVNDGRGYFTDRTSSQLRANPDRAKRVVAADVNGDGDVDLVIGADGQNKLYRNDGLAGFDDVTAPNLPEVGYTSYSAAVGDVDGDGDPDIVLGNWLGTSRLYLNDGSGQFADVTATQFPTATSWGRCHLLVDIDGDGDLDLVIGNGERGSVQDQLFVNDGKGTFTDVTTSQLPASVSDTRALAAGDLDGDGDVDLVIGQKHNGARLYLNDGRGTFGDQTSGRLSSARSVCSIALADVDGDGDLDALLAEGSDSSVGPVALHLNDGHGFFTDVTAAQMPNQWEMTQAIAVGDLDGDGDVDLVIAAWNTATSYGNRIYLNDGKGRFQDATASRLPASTEFSASVALGDVDEDGDLDIVLGNLPRWVGGDEGFRGGPNQLFLNNGHAHFVNAHVRMPKQSEFCRQVLLADVDGDSDLDILAANELQSRIHFNYHRHSFSGQNFGNGPASVTADYLLEFYSQLGYATVSKFVVPCVALGNGQIAIPPFGTYGLDLATTVIGAPLLVPAPLGYTAAVLHVPDASALIGRHLYVQGLMLEGATPATWRFTNRSSTLSL